MLTSLNKKTELLKEIIAALFIFVFAYTAFSKLWEHEKFVAVLSSSPLLGSRAQEMAYAVPGIEIAAIILLLIPSLRKGGLWVSAIIMSLFTIYIGYMILFASHLPCSCGGIIENLSWQQHLVFNIILIVLALIGLYPHKFFIAINLVLSGATAKQAGKAENLYKQ